MNRDKQIIDDLIGIFDEEYDKRRLITPQNTAEKLTAKGYRKASDVAREIFEEIEQEIKLAINSNYKAMRDAQDDNEGLVLYVEGKIDCLRGLEYFINELKKKYTEEVK